MKATDRPGVFTDRMMRDTGTLAHASVPVRNGRPDVTTAVETIELRWRTDPDQDLIVLDDGTELRADTDKDGGRVWTGTTCDRLRNRPDQVDERIHVAAPLDSPHPVAQRARCSLEVRRHHDALERSLREHKDLLARLRTRGELDDPFARADVKSHADQVRRHLAAVLAAQTDWALRPELEL